MDKERYIFDKFRSKLNGDDCAVIGERAYCKDLFVEGVHFRRGWLSLREIGAKAMLVNVSDMIATNARAKYALLGLALPREIGTREIDELCAGVSETAREWGIRIIGGDTIGSDRIALSVSLIGKCKRPVFRSGARVGDLIAHTGELGGVGRDLAVLLRDEISPASSQMQNRNDKISSLQDPSDEVRRPGDKISPARAEPQSLDAGISVENSVSQSGDDRKNPTAQDSGLQSGGYDDSAGKISTQFDNEISTQSFDGKISAPSPDNGNSTQDLNAYTACSVSQGSITQNLDTHASYDGLQGSATQNRDAEFFEQNFTTQNLSVGNSIGNFMAQKSAANYTAQSLACKNSTSQSSAGENPVPGSGLYRLREDLRAKISKNSRFVRPVLRDKFFYKAAKLISAAMDISDGLAQDLPRLLEASGVGARWIARPSEAALQSGEEYEILFSFAPKFLPKIYAIAAKTGVSINIIAEVCPRTPQSSMEFRGSSHHFAP
ncbi:thiamine-phosphate kinase [uncultured Campylobacter sp.]|uniref:thiamine-phosphate kinase n=1 Tax=uncultured Campylobacter sp. TaxID=218934 RepID=UPI00261DBBAB|nr:thiamine-phosphate kinase [uncultured Campylobacter sp.]